MPCPTARGAGTRPRARGTTTSPRQQPSTRASRTARQQPGKRDALAKGIFRRHAPRRHWSGNPPKNPALADARAAGREPGALRTAAGLGDVTARSAECAECGGKARQGDNARAKMKCKARSAEIPNPRFRAILGVDGYRCPTRHGRSSVSLPSRVLHCAALCGWASCLVGAWTWWARDAARCAAGCHPTGV